jgi:aminoglycoside phosphotransferase (APT) family kinase protein
MAPHSDMHTAVLNLTPAETADDPRATLGQRFEQLQDPSEALKILHCYVPSYPARVEAVCTPLKFYRSHSGRDDRFVVRVDTATTTGERETFVFKGYADGAWGQRIMQAFHTMAACHECPPDTCPVSRPLAYIPQERLLISRWVHGQTVWAHLQRGDSSVLARIPSVLAHLYRAPVLPEAAMTPQTLLDEVLRKYGKVCTRWPATATRVQPLMAALQEALPLLDPAPSALVHGDLNPDHCLWNGRHVTLIDPDNFRYTDPAYDAGYFLAVLHRQCLHHPALMPHVSQMLVTFRAAFLRAVPAVSTRNISFYYALTFARKMYRDLAYPQVAADWPRIVESYAHCAMSALQTGV